MFRVILANLGLIRYASPRDLLQYEVWSVHPHRKRIDQQKRLENALDTLNRWPHTLSEKILNNPYRENACNPN
jgi:hypothetical protein